MILKFKKTGYTVEYDTESNPRFPIEISTILKEIEEFFSENFKGAFRFGSNVTEFGYIYTSSKNVALFIRYLMTAIFGTAVTEIDAYISDNKFALKFSWPSEQVLTKTDIKTLMYIADHGGFDFSYSEIGYKNEITVTAPIKSTLAVSIYARSSRVIYSALQDVFLL